jgi:hypothetical protein
LKLWWPANGATGIVINPSLTWNPDPDALNYTLHVSTDSVFGATVLFRRAISTSSYEVDSLKKFTSYFWRVSVSKASGTSGWTPTFKFTVGNGIDKGTTPVGNGNCSIVPGTLEIYSCQNGKVRISLPASGTYRLALYTLRGQKAYALAQNAQSAGRATISMENADIPQGFYLMQLSGNGLVVRKNIFLTK